MNQHQTDIIFREAKAYANAKPHTTARQLRERFQSLMPEQCRKLMHRARIAAKERGETFVVPSGQEQRNEIQRLAKDYSLANPTITSAELLQLFPMSESLAQKIMREAREQKCIAPAKQAAILADSAKRKADAIEYARTHPHEYVTHIAKRFNVPTRAITAMRDAERQRRKREEAAKPKRRIRRLFAVLDDGSVVDPKKCRNIASAAKFVEVMA